MLKFVNWTKINRRDISDTIWDHLDTPDSESDDEPDDDPYLLNNQSIITKLSRADVFTSIEKNFCKNAAVPTKKLKKKVEKIELLDAKKAYAMDIFMTSLPKECQAMQLTQYVMSLSPLVLEEHVLTSLSKFAPSLEEMNKLKGYKGDMEMLSMPDKLSLEMIKVPQFKQRIECLLFKLTFWDKVDRLEKVKHSQ